MHDRQQFADTDDWSVTAAVGRRVRSFIVRFYAEHQSSYCI